MWHYSGNFLPWFVVHSEISSGYLKTFRVQIKYGSFLEVEEANCKFQVSTSWDSKVTATRDRCKKFPSGLAAYFSRFVYPGDSPGITKYHSDQYMRCWKQWRTDELVDVLCLSAAHKKVFLFFLDPNQFASNWPRMLDEKFDI